MSDRTDQPNNPNESNDSNHDLEGLAVPRRLVDGLRELHSVRSFVPPSVDEAILSRARAHLKPLPQPEEKVRIIRFPRWLAAAAVLVTGLGLALMLMRSERQSLPIVREDVDRNGHVDILDAFTLARKLQGGAAADASLDVNGDGVIDQLDVDWIAARSVSLPKG